LGVSVSRVLNVQESLALLFFLVNSTKQFFLFFPLLAYFLSIYISSLCCREACITNIFPS
jgi:hypothetical protein